MGRWKPCVMGTNTTLPPFAPPLHDHATAVENRGLTAECSWCKDRYYGQRDVLLHARKHGPNLAAVNLCTLLLLNSAIKHEALRATPSKRRFGVGQSLVPACRISRSTFISSSPALPSCSPSQRRSRGCVEPLLGEPNLTPSAAVLGRL